MDEIKLSIDPLAISEEFCETPATLAYWNAQYAEAVGPHLRAKANVERVYAETYRKVREEYADRGLKATETMVNTSVETDSDYALAREQLISAEVEKIKLRGRVEAITTKRDMLISLGAHIRAEMDDPIIRKQARDSREVVPY